jgi:hypothetical protein
MSTFPFRILFSEQHVVDHSKVSFETNRKASPFTREYLAISTKWDPCRLLESWKARMRKTGRWCTLCVQPVHAYDTTAYN